jgi:hypothetical protein
LVVAGFMDTCVSMSCCSATRIVATPMTQSLHLALPFPLLVLSLELWPVGVSAVVIPLKARAVVAAYSARAAAGRSGGAVACEASAFLILAPVAAREARV